MLMPYTTMVRHRPGQIANRGAMVMYWRPPRLSMPPQLGTSGGRPKPRKLSEASATMMAPMVIEKMMMMGGMTFGSTCRHRICAAGLPTARAAWK